MTTTYVVKPGDTLRSIASDVLGDPNRWVALARHNALRDPRALHPGMKLALPPTNRQAGGGS
jgi:nucleoid-associated protein YgaU